MLDEALTKQIAALTTKDDCNYTFHVTVSDGMCTYKYELPLSGHDSVFRVARRIGAAFGIRNFELSGKYVLNG